METNKYIMAVISLSRQRYHCQHNMSLKKTNVTYDNKLYDDIFKVGKAVAMGQSHSLSKNKNLPVWLDAVKP